MNSLAKQNYDAYKSQIDRLAEMQAQTDKNVAAVQRDNLSQTSTAWAHYLDAEATPDERTAYEAFRKGAQLHRVCGVLDGVGAVVKDGNDFHHLSERASDLLCAATEIAVPIRAGGSSYLHHDSLGKVDHVAEMQKQRAGSEKQLRSDASLYFDPKTGRPTREIIEQTRTGRLKGSLKEEPGFDKRYGF